MPSPCLKVCGYDAAREICRGCGRTLAEIESWWELDEAEQLRIMAELPARLNQKQPPAN